jgi:hypothetical protein
MIASLRSEDFGIARTPSRPPASSYWLRLAVVAMIVAAVAIGSFGLAGATSRTVASASGNPFADLSLPEIAVTITNQEFADVPARLTAGRYVLSVTNAFHDSTEETSGAALLQLPDDISASEFIASVRDDEGAWPPDWYYATPLAGGAYAVLGATAYAVIDLTAGDWILWSEAPGAPQAPVPITVTGEFPANPPAPIADATVELSEFAFAFSAPFKVGQQIIEVVNSGEQPHFLFIGGVPDGATVAEAQAAFEAFWDPDSAPPSAFSFAETPELLGVGDQSAGTTTWHAVDLPPGTALFACFVIDPESGEPHAMLGMTEIVVID